MSVAEELVNLRLKYGWSQDEAASLAGVAPTTWFRAERADETVNWSRGLRAKTLRGMLETLLACAVPISIDDAHAVLDAAGISRAAVRVPTSHRSAFAAAPASPSDVLNVDAAVRLVQLAFALAARVGADRAESILRQITDIPVAGPITPPTDPRAALGKQYLRVYEPPRKRPDGSVEQVVRGYETPPPAAASDAPRRAAPGKQ